MRTDQSIGEAAYNMYCNRVGWVSRFTKERLPAFEDQPTDIQLAWEAAAGAAVDQYEDNNASERWRQMNLPDDTDWDHS